MGRRSENAFCKSLPPWPFHHGDEMPTVRQNEFKKSDADVVYGGKHYERPPRDGPGPPVRFHHQRGEHREGRGSVAQMAKPASARPSRNISASRLCPCPGTIRAGVPAKMNLYSPRGVRPMFARRLVAMRPAPTLPIRQVLPEIGQDERPVVMLETTEGAGRYLHAHPTIRGKGVNADEWHHVGTAGCRGYLRRGLAKRLRAC